MSAGTLNLQGADPLRPRPPGGMGRGALLALGVHALLVVALAVAVSGRSQTPQTFSAELWSATPQVAAPRAVESTAANAADIVIETLQADVSERGATRMDDKTSEASMEKRKKDGYF